MICVQQVRVQVLYMQELVQCELLNQLHNQLNSLHRILHHHLDILQHTQIVWSELR